MNPHPAQEALALWKSLIATGTVGNEVTIKMDEPIYNKLDDLLTTALQSASREWMPVDENTPKDKRLLLWDGQDEPYFGQWYENKAWPKVSAFRAFAGGQSREPTFYRIITPPKQGA